MIAIRPLSKTILVLLFFMPVSIAHSSIYGGISALYTNAEYSHSSTSDSVQGHPIILQGQVGFFFNDYVAVEGRYGTSIKRSGGLIAEDLFSAFVKGNLPITNQVALYALTGYSSAKLDQQQAGSSSEGGISFGLGAHYAFGKQTAVTIEYVNYFSDDTAKLGGFNLSYQYRF
ncbi:outer membrane beta-barrel protein [Agarivorans gilvus]|uniref:Outer membrane protein beta-barrel domain-containing protein n=1 Tax=Agarivorans gilvus TaxID=680279 RepID=A0ABQ1HZW5_9ALTE|nr:outer membrane beta-barrel protein [Agarivorans gilvus]GGA98801.1 hypothetical protein GCM10007414_09780 [Agarivorans gilvus]